MPNLNLVSSRLSSAPATDTMYEYVVAGNGLFVRAEDSRLEACIPVAAAHCPGLAPLVPEVRLKLPRIPAAYLAAVHQSACRKLPNEAAYQFVIDGALPWRCICPEQVATPAGVDYLNDGDAVVDLHSHGVLPAFWSATDNCDECGLRFYVVVGNLGEEFPTLRARVGVYGHHYDIPAFWIFESVRPFVEITGESNEATSE